MWANRHEGLKRFATDSLQSLAGRGIVQPAFIAGLLKEHLPAHPGYYGEMVWILLMLEHWFRGPRRAARGLSAINAQITLNRPRQRTR